MGYQTAVGFTSTDTTLEEQLAMHFAANCYPRIPRYLIPVGVEALYNVDEPEICRDYELLDKPINLPGEVTVRGEDTVSSIDAVEKLFLGAFVDGMLMDEWSIEEE